MKTNKETKVVCPNCGAEFAIPEHEHLSVGIAIGKDSGLGVIHPEVVGQHTSAPITNNNNNSNNTNTTSKTAKEMKATEKLEALRAAGVNVANLFSMKGVTGEETIARLDNGQLTIVPDNDPIFAAIMGGGTIPNRKLFRRWVMAQVFHMMGNSHEGFTESLNRKGYKYMWKMLLEELRVQAVLSHKDRENFAKRNLWFNKERVAAICAEYLNDLPDYLEGLKVKRCKGVPYVHLRHRDVFVSDLKTKVLFPLGQALSDIVSSNNADKLYKATCDFFQIVKKTRFASDMHLPQDYKDAYKGAGAYFTMENLILFHGAKFRGDKGRFLSKDASMKMLKEAARDYQFEGWRLFGMMKLLLDQNGINVADKLREWRK